MPTSAQALGNEVQRQHASSESIACVKMLLHLRALALSKSGNYMILRALELSKSGNHIVLRALAPSKSGNYRSLRKIKLAASAGSLPMGFQGFPKLAQRLSKLPRASPRAFGKPSKIVLCERWHDQRVATIVFCERWHYSKWKL